MPKTKHAWCSPTASGTLIRNDRKQFFLPKSAKVAGTSLSKTSICVTPAQKNMDKRSKRQEDPLRTEASQKSQAHIWML